MGVPSVLEMVTRTAHAGVVMAALLWLAHAAGAEPPAPAVADEEDWSGADPPDSSVTSMAASETAGETDPSAPLAASNAGVPPPVLDPAADAARSEYWRHEVELIPELGMAWPRCHEGQLSSRNCEGTGFLGNAGFTALWRVSPFFAWGGELTVAAFRYDPPEASGRDQGSAASVSLMLLLRG